MNVLFIALIGLVGGVLNRVRGGGFPWFYIKGATKARLLFTAPLTVLVAWLLLDGVDLTTAIYLSPLLFAELWLGVLLGWGSYTDLGRMPEPDNEFLKPLLDSTLGDESTDVLPEDAGFVEMLRSKRWWRDFVGLSLRGLVWTLPAGFVATMAAGFFGGVWCPAALWGFSGIAMGVIYEVSWRLPSTVGCLKRGPELGEFLMGVWLFGTVAALGLAASTPV